MIGLPGSARTREGRIEGYRFPPSVTASAIPGSDAGEAELLERGLRDWFICWAHRRRRTLWLPSRAVDLAWVAFMADEAAYDDFCSRVFCRRIMHPRDGGASDRPRAMFRTVRAWDRSRAAKQGDSVLWSLDEQLQIDSPRGIGFEALEQVRTKDDPRYGGPYMYGGGASSGGM